ncbi:MAG TPA: hypothetical protein P5233_12215, partial [Candidatus Paceibacterota bacterium]|nr:hypothetical protein [Candidatus Paceibacterota bacterium]
MKRFRVMNTSGWAEMAGSLSARFRANHRARWYNARRSEGASAAGSAARRSSSRSSASGWLHWP